MNSPWPPPCGYLPQKEPQDVVDRTFIVLPVTTTSVVTASLAAAPSGTGELVLADLRISADSVIVNVSGGVAGRVYTLMSLITTANGAVYETLAFLPIDNVLETDPPPIPPSQGFGTPLTWRVPNLDFSRPTDSMYLL